MAKFTERTLSNEEAKKMFGDGHIIIAGGVTGRQLARALKERRELREMARMMELEGREALGVSFSFPPIKEAEELEPTSSWSDPIISISERDQRLYNQARSMWRSLAVTIGILLSAFTLVYVEAFFHRDGGVVDTVTGIILMVLALGTVCSFVMFTIDLFRYLRLMGDESD